MKTNSESVIERGIPRKCACGMDVAIFTSKTQENPGRSFFRCVSKKDKHLFKWVEDVVIEEIADGKQEIEEMKKRIQELNRIVDESRRGIRIFMGLSLVMCIAFAVKIVQT